MENLSKEQIVETLNGVIGMLNSQQPAINTADVLIKALRAMPEQEKINFMKRMAVALTPTVLDIAAEFQYDAEDFSIDITHDNRIEINDVVVNMHFKSNDIERSVRESFIGSPIGYINEIIDDL